MPCFADKPILLFQEALDEIEYLEGLNEPNMGCDMMLTGPLDYQTVPSLLQHREALA